VARVSLILAPKDPVARPGEAYWRARSKYQLNPAQALTSGPGSIWKKVEGAMGGVQ
jgi:hypothetical protein